MNTGGNAVVAHGSAEQRVRWLTRGFESGNPNACDTFSVAQAQL